MPFRFCSCVKTRKMWAKSKLKTKIKLQNLKERKQLKHFFRLIDGLPKSVCLPVVVEFFFPCVKLSIFFHVAITTKVGRNNTAVHSHILGPTFCFQFVFTMYLLYPCNFCLVQVAAAVFLVRKNSQDEA